MRLHLCSFTVRNYKWNVAFACSMTLLDEITLHLPRMHCKSEAKLKWRRNFGLFLADKNVRKYPLEWSYDLQNW